MRRCIVAQSGGPTPVINASVAGVLVKNQTNKYYDEVLGGINGIEGILQEKIIDLNYMEKSQIIKLKYTPSSALGSCRYKLRNMEVDDTEYKRFFQILDKYDIETFFYIGGNDSMDTVSKLSWYSSKNSINKRIIGIPKTVDNDLINTDHCPGYGSAARLIGTITLETYLDSSVYSNNGVFILETMGRDTGWLAASASLANIDNEPVADFIYLPEIPFNIESFLQDIAQKYSEKQHVFIVVSEGIRDINGNFISEIEVKNRHDNFGHAQLGGVSSYLGSQIKKANITQRVKSLELGVIQRCGLHIVSTVDIEEAFHAGMAAVQYSAEGYTGSMVSIERICNKPYKSQFIMIDVSDICNKVKYFPLEWINRRGNFIIPEASKYIKPLVSDSFASDDIILGKRYLQKDGLPLYYQFDKTNILNKINIDSL